MGAAGKPIKHVFLYCFWVVGGVPQDARRDSVQNAVKIASVALMLTPFVPKMIFTKIHVKKKLCNVI